MNGWPCWAYGMLLVNLRNWIHQNEIFMNTSLSSTKGRIGWFHIGVWGFSSFLKYKRNHKGDTQRETLCIKIAFSWWVSLWETIEPLTVRSELCSPFVAMPLMSIMGSNCNNILILCQGWSEEVNVSNKTHFFWSITIPFYSARISLLM